MGGLEGAVGDGSEGKVACSDAGEGVRRAVPGFRWSPDWRRPHRSMASVGKEMAFGDDVFFGEHVPLDPGDRLDAVWREISSAVFPQ